MSQPLIQWYPGHIAKAEKALSEQLKRVDVVIEVRDARIPIASTHPKIATWTEGRSHLLVMNRLDMISGLHQKQLQRWFNQQEQEVFFTNAKDGDGIKQLLKAAQVAGIRVNERRHSRGMLPRPVRAAVIGFPNVGKSALINRLLNRRVAESSNRPGVTRQLRWIRISDAIELLDTPGNLPSLLGDQDAAVKLAICDDIGQAAYDNVLIAAAAVDKFKEIGVPLHIKYGISAKELSGMEYIEAVAKSDRYNGDFKRVADLILHDFRKGRLGAIALEYPFTEI
ncbi:ribosome biogenesis GTPase YlqF [Synechococcus sp. PCC 7502]|uniref:ribosome biogenesis GTPase YlqF n=1 Tax=Synechococcus sp. PCC 7502 TaxID=1173263 RepID=UPI00031EAD2A|nr:ribosome biogenesis GTPase YlqF [Synechococcus sp. PCC 7502]